QDADLTDPRALDDLEGEIAVERMRTHDGDEDHAAAGEIPLMQREAWRARIGRPLARGFLAHEASNAVSALPGRELLGEAGGWLRGAVRISDQAPEGCVEDIVCGHGESPETKTARRGAGP